MTRPVVLATLVALAAASPLAAQDPPRGIDFGRGADSVRTPTVPGDSLIALAVRTFNAAGAARIWGDFTQPAGSVHEGHLALFGGALRLEGTVHGDVLVINGDLRVGPGARIDGWVLVLGGALVLDPGAVIGGEQRVFVDPVPVVRAPDGTLAMEARRRRALRDFANTATTLVFGPVDVTLRVDATAYNRVEGLPVGAGPIITWRPDARHTATLDLLGIWRTAGDPTAVRGDFGWTGRLGLQREGVRPVRLTVEAGSAIVPTRDQPLRSLESGLSAFLWRRDYRDWYASRWTGASLEVRATPRLTVTAGYVRSRERSVLAVEAFSLFRTDEPWRPNPQIDDGLFRTLRLGLAYDSRDTMPRPTSGWYVQGEFARVSGSGLTPVSLPERMRDPMPTSGYAALQFDFDARRYLRISPTQSVHLRVAGGGHVVGDPQTVQRRRSLDGVDPMLGYGFRALSCDRRRAKDPAAPALCDRTMVAQVEYRRTLGLRTSTRLGNYTVGLQRPDLVIALDGGSAWLSGDGPGRVPAGRIQRFSEWRSSVAIGLQTTTVGLFLAKAIADPLSPQLVFRIGRRF